LWAAQWMSQKRKETRTTVELWVSTVKDLCIFCMATKLLSLELLDQELQVATTMVQATQCPLILPPPLKLLDTVKHVVVRRVPKRKKWVPWGYQRVVHVFGNKYLAQTKQKNTNVMGILYVGYNFRPNGSTPI